MGCAETEAEATRRALATAISVRATEFVHGDVRHKQIQLLNGVGIGTQMRFGKVCGVSFCLTVEVAVRHGVKHGVGKCSFAQDRIDPA
jgi:hypothetical protein